jgi:hypothetical protein
MLLKATVPETNLLPKIVLQVPAIHAGCWQQSLAHLFRRRRLMTALAMAAAERV